MLYPSFQPRAKHKQPVTAGLIGVGSYGTAVLTQSIRIPALHIPVISDQSMAAARLACQRAGISDERVVPCGSRAQALRAMESGRYVIIEDPLLMMELPIDVVVESTGSAESGALHAREAIRHGKHVAMINKETDCVVGPMLKYLADSADLVYTAVDGDQHGLLIGFVRWIRSLGIDVVCAGKSRDLEFVYDREAGWVSHVWESNTVHENCRYFPPPDRWPAFDFLSAGQVRQAVDLRWQILKSLPAAAPFDICESVIAANATGLSPDIPSLHNPILRTQEIPEALCPEEEGGMLRSGGVIDLVTCLRGHREAGLGGGVFAVVSCENEYSRRMVLEKGLHSNRRGSTAVLYRPYHLCGVETPTSIVCAGLLQLPTGADVYLPRFDMIYKAVVDLKQGERLDCQRGQSLSAEMVPAIPLTGKGLLPAYLGYGQKLTRDVPAGTFVGQEMVNLPEESILLGLRRRQDTHFAVG